MAAGIVLITIFIMICTTLLISQYMEMKAQIGRNEAKQIRETLQQMQDNLTQIEARIAEIVIELHDRERR
ncbi:TPA: hypothetical protein EYP66_04180 [Candidatus Poribacteria bacterium]|nr:hypothetical protein [Candidatus Poribacteria bacterium]